MKIIQDFISEGRKNRPGIFMRPEFITVHDTANTDTGADAEAHAQYLKSDRAANRPVSWHFTVDGGSIKKDGTVKPPQIYQHLPVDEVGWHAGDGHGPGNMSSIGVEICENMDGDRGKAEELAAELVAWLLQKLELDIGQVIQHHHWTGKDCPRVLRNRPGGWAGFINTVKSKIGGGKMFKDIDQAMYPTIIEKAAHLGLIAGYSDGTFRPKEPVTREQLIYFLMRYRERDIHQTTISDLVKRWKDSIVLITNVGQDGKLSFGSGSFIDSAGTILTNKHVTDGHKKLTVKIYNKYHRDAEFICDSTGMTDQGNYVDLALIKVQTSQPTPPIKFAKDIPEHGEFCVVLGAPLVLEESATFGIVSHNKREQYIQIDAAVNPGNSGGACFNMRGEMIGVPTLKYVGEAIDNIAYLTSVPTIKKFLAEKR